MDDALAQERRALAEQHAALEDLKRQLQERVAVGFLIAAGDERVDAERVRVRGGLGLLHQDAEHAALVDRQGRPG